MNFQKISFVEEIDHEGPVYDIELEKNHYFSANGIFTHNCRLRSDILSPDSIQSDTKEYSNSFGSGSSKIGSLGVVTINMARLAFKHQGDIPGLMSELRELVEDAQDINNAKRHIIKKKIENGNQPLYSLGFMELKKQYSTVGINGFYEAVDTMGFDILSEEGQEFALNMLNLINDMNDRAQRKYTFPHNVEQVPAESVGVKLVEKDVLLKYNDGRYQLYSNQFLPLTHKADLLDRIKLQGLFDSEFSGGAICHLNVENRIEDPKKLENLIEVAAKKGVIYFAINMVLSECENGHMTVSRGETCTQCGAKIVNRFTRIVGYLTKVASWNKVRREVDFPNRQFYTGNGDVEIAA